MRHWPMRGTDWSKWRGGMNYDELMSLPWERARYWYAQGCIGQIDYNNYLTA